MRDVSKYEAFSGPYFPTFGLNTERYEVSIYIIQTRKNSVFGHILGSGCVVYHIDWWNINWNNRKTSDNL